MKTQKKETKGNISKKTKAYVIDTNVLVHDPYALFAFDGEHVFLPITVLEELDRFKKEGTDRGRNTRQVIRQLDTLRSKGNLGTGIILENKSTLEVLVATDDDIAQIKQKAPSSQEADNTIIAYALLLQQRGYNVHFVSKDLNARVKADVFGIHAEDYIKESVPENEIFRGFHTLDVPSIELKKEDPKALESIEDTLLVNEFVLMRSQHNEYNYTIARYLGKKEGFIHTQKDQLSWPIKPKNFQQSMALDLLLDPTIQLVSLIGPAGTGKTFLALLAGLYSVIVQKKYEKILVSRPVIPLGRDIGFLPGTVEEKLQSWMLPIYDNLDLIIHTINAGIHEHNPMTEHKKNNEHYKKSKYRDKKRQEHSNTPHHEQRRGVPSITELIRTGRLGLEAITYMRGRSIPYQFIVIDEAQNLSRHEVKTLITRAGEGSKIVLTGDPYQIDSPYLDFSSNGIVVCTEKFKGNRIFGTIFLDISERSDLSRIASELL